LPGRNLTSADRFDGLVEDQSRRPLPKTARLP
jgi:hypothetical protein